MYCRLAISAIMLLLSLNTSADALAVKGGISSWWPGAEGPRNSGDSEQVFSAFAALEHPVPFVPNARLRVWDYSGEREGGIDLTTVDAILYYEIFDNDAIDLDLGVAATHFRNGRIGFDDTFSGWLPQAYGTLRMPVTGSGTGFGLYAEGTGTHWEGSRTLDIEGGVDFKIDAPLLDVLFRAGYRHVTNDLDDFDRVDGKLEFSGFAIGVIVDL
ncbi:TIGR04219 family outer membrane beta-barrel protein [Chromatocurvus halotolerans]|uniref:Outer membrane protein n=1 Tax=Chromatocurvus halotolerans TaxID=1132028 RepID=A0A4R2L9Y8_9GAMM|nr:TIGR04219 family outer membrane beta-barrel protein [Chromatocurvus halotolerans]TCO76065.1 outer membrane protein [Chromatocurvus halotolerans]